MESIQNSIQELSEHFNTRMAEFQKSLQSSIPATSPTSNIAGQFSAFRTFVLSALEGLQQQVTFLSTQCDQMEMRSRKKMLLLHGIPEENKENTSVSVSRILSNQLKLPALQEDCLTRCQRIGESKGDRPRVILLKFRDIALRNQVWFSKTSLKSTGMTLSEFLTKPRHDAFLAARQKFGVNKCWTKDGIIIIAGSDGKRHRVISLKEVNSISVITNPAQVPNPSAASSFNVAQAPRGANPSHPPRPKRPTKR